jgi:hypothetical protein
MQPMTTLSQLLEAAQNILLVDWPNANIPRVLIDKGLTVYGYASLGLKVSISELDITLNGTAGGQLDAVPSGSGDLDPVGQSPIFRCQMSAFHRR